VIDLHTHTTASDGRNTPAELVARASASGLQVLAVTDHDTIAGCAAASLACTNAGIQFVAGIEISSVLHDEDVHVLGYFVDVESASLRSFLDEQRVRRVERIRQVVERLNALGMPLDADAIVRPAVDDRSKSIGRPAVARAMVAAGYTASTGLAFDKWLSHGRPAYVPRPSLSPVDAFGKIHEAGGLASLAHPGLMDHDDWIPQFADAGLDAIEAYHPNHDDFDRARYLHFAERLGLVVSGGSDYHADESHGASHPGVVSLPRVHFDALVRRHQTNIR
jgi:predicted metal-dependent phosphoesterase TrpH